MEKQDSWGKTPCNLVDRARIIEHPVASHGALTGKVLCSEMRMHDDVLALDTVDFSCGLTNHAAVIIYLV